jgi:putative ABC transport system permease protein
MPFTEAIRLALQTIWHSKLRSFFTLLGIIVSVGFLVVVVAVIQGMNAYVKENLTGAMIGTNAFQVRRSPISVGLLEEEQIRKFNKRPPRMPRLCSEHCLMRGPSHSSRGGPRQ